MTIYLYNPSELRSHWRSYLDRQKNALSEISLSGTPNSSGVSFKWNTIPIPTLFCAPNIKKLGIRQMELVDEKSLIINNTYIRNIALIVPVNNNSQIYPSRTLITTTESKNNGLTENDDRVLALYEHWLKFIDLNFSMLFHTVCEFDQYNPENTSKCFSNITPFIEDMPEQGVICKKTLIDGKTAYIQRNKLVSLASLAIHIARFVERVIGNNPRLSEAEEKEIDQKTANPGKRTGNERSLKTNFL